MQSTRPAVQRRLGRVCRLALFAGCLGLGLSAQGKEGSESSPPQQRRIGQLIEQLGSESFKERESAVAELRALGDAARGELLEARHHKSAEVRSRASALIRQLDVVPLLDAFQAFARQPDEKLDLEEGMWLISRILNKDVQRLHLARQLDQLADAVRQKLGRQTDPKSVDPEILVETLRETLFTDAEFNGNINDYNNPANSSLEHVLKLKRGLPILLSHVVIAVGKRLDVPIVGVPTSGRYIIKYDGKRAPAGFSQADIFIDPFNGGKVLSREDRMDLFPTSDPDKLVEPQSRRKDLIRMLNNLESHLFNRDEVDGGYQAVQFRQALEAQAPAP